jgi:hypothetical protein|nr:MAG TPA: protein of unknown function (DUF4376) [Caudoviricetes sp.]
MSTNKHFYLLDENNNISSFADYKFDKNALEAQDEIIQGYDGRYYFASQCPQQPLEELKLIKREEINQARDAAEQGGFEYLGKTFDSDQISAQRISMAAQAMALADDTAKITWTCQDNTTIDLNKTQLVGMVAALAEWSNTCHQKATALKAKIDAAETAEELENITWEDNPATL